MLIYQLFLVSAGFDAAAGDNIGGCFVTPEGFAQMTALLKTLANGKIVVCLEVDITIATYPTNILTCI